MTKASVSEGYLFSTMPDNDKNGKGPPAKRLNYCILQKEGDEPR